MVPIHKIQLPDSNEHWLEFNAKYEIFGTGTEGGPCPPVWSGSGKVASVHSRDLFHALICTTGTLANREAGQRMHWPVCRLCNFRRAATPPTNMARQLAPPSTCSPASDGLRGWAAHPREGGFVLSLVFVRRYIRPVTCQTPQFCKTFFLDG